MICTCDACHYTFSAETLPSSCPDCGKERLNRRVDDRFLTAPAVREATAEETGWFENVQRELRAEEMLEQLCADMTSDEYNWSLIMLFLHPVPKTKDARLILAAMLSSIRQEPQRAKELYPTIRRMFTQKINEDRSALSAAGMKEPSLFPDTAETIENWDQFGPALRILYQFKPDSEIPAFLSGPPNLGNVRRIDLKKIADEPSAAYLQFLLNWENLLIDAE